MNKHHLTVTSPPTNLVLASRYDAKGMGVSSIKAVIFDWDGTITGAEDVYKAYKTAIDAKMLADGYEATGQVVPKGSGLTDGKRAEVMFRIPIDEQGVPKKRIKDGVELDFEPVADHAYAVAKELAGNKRLMEDVVQHVKLRDGAVETFKFLREHHIPFAIASNSPQDRTVALVGKVMKKALATYQQEHPEEDTFKFYPKKFTSSEMHKNDVPVLGTLSDAEGKPNTKLLKNAAFMLGVDLTKKGEAEGVVFVGDNLKSDVYAALNAGFRPVLIGGAHENPEEARKQFAMLEGGANGVGEPHNMVAYVNGHHELVDYLKAHLSQQVKTTMPAHVR